MSDRNTAAKIARAAGAAGGALIAVAVGDVPIPFTAYLGAEAAKFLADTTQAVVGNVAAGLASDKLLETWQDFAGEDAELQHEAFHAVQAALQAARTAEHVAWFEAWSKRLARVDPKDKSQLDRLWGDHGADCPVRILADRKAWINAIEPTLLRWANDQAIEDRKDSTRARGVLLDLNEPTPFGSLDDKLRKRLAEKLYPEFESRFIKRIKDNRAPQAKAFKAVVIEFLPRIYEKVDVIDETTKETLAVTRDMQRQMAVLVAANQAGSDADKATIKQQAAEIEQLRQESDLLEGTRQELDQTRRKLAVANAELEQLVAAIAERDPNYAARLAAVTRQFQDLGDTPEREAAVERYTRGDLRSGFDELQRITESENRAADARKANRLRQLALLGLDMLDRQEMTSAEALALWQQAQEADPTHHWGWIELARLHQSCGSLAAARSAATRALATANDGRDRSVAQAWLADLDREQGDLTSARSDLKQVVAALQELAKRNPDSAEAQRDLSVSFEKLGDVEREAGALDAARDRYEQSLKIREDLAERNPDSAQAQRDLSVSYNKLGDVEREAGALDAARSRYEQDLKISEELAKRNPDSAEAQRDLSVSYNKLGDVEQEAGALDAARSCYEQDLKISEELAKLNPDSAEAQRDLLVSCAKLGMVTDDSSWWCRARTIAEELHAEGRLAPTDHRMLPMLREKCPSPQ